MKRILILVSIMTFITCSLNAQENIVSKSLALGFQLNQYQKDFVLGGYGLLGFEFYPHRKGCYFIELGGVGTGATADKIPSSPIYSNGFLISTGIRFHLR